MKSVSAVLASAVAVAATDAYGYGYAAPSSTSSAKPGYTTIHPGYGHEPVTVTAQYQPVPTYVDGKSSEYLYVSTVIKGYNGEDCTITKTDQDVMLYSTQSTITHYRTEPAQGYAKPTGAYGYMPKNETVVKPYYELYEQVHEAKYKDLGPKALPGYKGSELYKGSKDKQTVQIREYKDGKWSVWVHVFDYGLPKPSATTFKAPGVYTIPAYEKTLTQTETMPVQAQITAPAHEPVTYGGYTISVDKPQTVTVTYPANYETHGAKTITVYKTKTVTCTNAGKYEVAKPTTTVFDKATTFAYPTTTVLPPGVYHHTKETVTVTKSNEPYTCKYQATSKLPESYPTPSKVAEETYPTETPSATTPNSPDPSSDYEEPLENYGTAYAGTVKRGGLIERRKAESQVKAASNKRVILV